MDNRAVEAVIRIARDAAHKALLAYAALPWNETKTVGTYQRQAWRVCRDLYNGEIDEYQFVDDFSSFIDNQFGRAWRQGARDMGVNPDRFTDADIDALAERISAERDYMLQLADDIMAARAKGSGADQFRARSDMYANRYNDIVNQAHVHFGGKQMLEWQYGPTEHCSDCSRLNGIVATAEDWDASGWRPQSHDLECGGYHCLCHLLPSDKAPTPGGIPGK